ncbi:hypothetical protein WJX72_012015 [[Myrmecia] bisecta]|uniref:starch synthase n=1 Tax=[Myrmecia] bisecta TaxID=41462 RepID=A0AAW1R9J2_9CHLO
MRLQPLVAHRTDSTRLCAARRAANARTPRSKTLTKSASTAGRGRSSTPEARKATIAKISAAKALARKLAEEKQAAMVAARLLSDSSVDEEEVDAIKQSVERASTEAAREAARADAMARAAKKSGLQGAELLEFQRLKAENDALRQLVLDVAANREEAEARMARLQQSYNRLVEQASLGSQMSMDEEVAPASSDEAAAAARQEDIVKVVMGLALAKKTLEREQPSAPEEPKTPPPPVPQPKPQPSLPALVDAANKAGTAIFTVPEAGAPVPGTVTLYYNRNAGPLPFGAQCQFKMGINKWEDIVLRDMEAVALQDGDWWQIEITLDADVFRVNYVINDKSSGIVDNNRGQDFSLALVDAPTEEEVFARRAAAVQALEEQLRQDVEREEARLWEESRARAVQQADEARQRYRADREAELRMEAGELVAERRSGLDALPTSDGREGVFGWLRGRPQAGQEATLVYNKNAGALRNSADVQVNLGYDHWWQQDIKEIRLSRMPIAEVERNGLPRHNCDWWECTVQIPSSAAILDYVFCDTAKRAWDNNGMADYHTAIADALSDAELERHFCNTVLHISEQELQEGMERAAKRAVRRAEIKATAQRKRRDKQRQVLYTNPVFPKAGEHADVFYNPDATVLRGRPETWVRGSWNRWTHPQCFMPQRMLPVIPGGTGFHKASLQVPSDAHVMDLVFSDVGDMHGGFYDSNNGLDYHIPVVGSPGKLPSLHVVHVAVEMAPIAKVGGMGDVVTALARAVQDEGHRVEVILPKFDCINYAEVRNLRLRGDFFWSNSQVKVWEAVVENVQTILLEPTNGFFWVGCIYGRNDDAQRFGYFCGAALEYLKHHSGGTRPDIIHCHDWQTAPVAFGDCHPSRPVFTIHNLNYGADLIGRAMAAAAVATTVSPTYAAEVSGHPAVAPHMAKFYGIINGIDQDIWDPEEDRFLPKNFGVEDVAEGKAAAKAALRQRMDLSAAEVPLVAVVTRLTHQKGIHLIKHAAWRTLERGAQFVLLGSAPDPRVQAEFNQLADTLRRQYPDRARLWFAYDEPLSHLIYAGADMLLVPSMFEPCGLTQMIGMRYGTIPVVRRTGGLNDTVFDLDDDEERAQQHGMERNGFSFDGTDAGGMDYALNRALSSWFEGHESGEWTRLQQRVMQQDWSWTAPAEDYIELYYKALKPQG